MLLKTFKSSLYRASIFSFLLQFRFLNHPLTILNPLTKLQLFLWSLLMFRQNLLPLFSDHCEPNPCLNGGKCKQDMTVDEGYTCSCRSGYFGPDCSMKDVCTLEVPCMNGGSCVTMGKQSLNKSHRFRIDPVEDILGVTYQL